MASKLSKYDLTRQSAMFLNVILDVFKCVSIQWFQIESDYFIYNKNEICLIRIILLWKIGSGFYDGSDPVRTYQHVKIGICWIVSLFRRVTADGRGTVRHGALLLLEHLDDGRRLIACFGVIFSAGIFLCLQFKCHKSLSCSTYFVINFKF